MRGEVFDVQRPRLFQLTGLKVLVGEEIRERGVIGVESQQPFQFAGQFAFPLQLVERLGQEFIGLDPLPRQSLLEALFQAGNRLGVFSTLGIDPREIKLQ